MAKEGMHFQNQRQLILSENPPFPGNMIMEVTNACNDQCMFCGNRNQTRKLTMADKELFFSIIDQAIENGVREIGFYLGGEPFLNKGLEEYVAYAAQKRRGGIEYLYVTTNGAYATIDRLRKLAECGLNSIKFSINAGSRETYQAIHGQDDFEKVKKNVGDLHSAIQAYEFTMATYVTFVKCRQNAHEVEKFKKTFEPLVDKVYIGEVNAQSGKNPAIEKVKLDGMEIDHAKWPCAMLFNRLHVTSDGYLDACCTDYSNITAVEDLSQVSLIDAWFGERMRTLRREHLDRTPSRKQCWYCINNATGTEVEPLNQDLYERCAKP